MAERLELVTDFGALSAGMIVVVGCGVGSSDRTITHKHRGLLLRLVPSLREPGKMAWELVPNPHPERYEQAVVSASTIGYRCVWRVIDGPESSDQQTKKQPAPKKRERTA